MKIIGKFASLLLCAVIAAPTLASAQYETDEYGKLDFHGNVDVSNAVVYEGGNAAFDAMNNDRYVVYTVLSADDYENLDSMSDEEYLSKLLYAGQTEFDDSGDYDISLFIKGKSGTYKLIVRTSMSDEDEVYDFEHTSYFYIEYNEALESGDKEQIIKFLDTYIQYLDADYVAYKHLGDKAKSDIAEALLKGSKATSNEDVISFVGKFNLLSIISENSADASELESYFKDIATYSGSKFNTPYIKCFVKELSEQEGTDILSKYAGKALPDNFAEEFTYDIFSTMYSKMTYYPEYEKLINYEENPFGFADGDIEKYKESSEQKGVLRAFSEKLSVASNITDVRSALAYAVKNPVIDDNSGGSSGGGGGKTSSKSGSSVSVPAVNKNPQPGSDVEHTSKFDDMAGFEWAKDAVDTLAANGIINGISDNEFAPGSYVTREQFVKMLTAGLRLTGVEAEFEYSDVSKNDWFYNAVGAAARAGIASGIGDGKFGVGTSITREDMAVMLSRSAAMRGAALKDGELLGFADSGNIADYAKDAVNKLSASGIINGDGTNFYPKNTLTRAEAAKALYEFLKYINEI